MQNCRVLAQKISFCVWKIVKLYLKYLQISFAFVAVDEPKNKLTITPLSENFDYESESFEEDNAISDQQEQTFTEAVPGTLPYLRWNFSQ